MHRSLTIVGLCLAVSACTMAPVSDQLTQTNIAISHTECQGSARVNCAFFNAPVKLQKTGVKLASRKATFFPTAAQLDFVDARATRWIAPKATLTDGASIPNIFVSVIGIPTSPEFLNASAMHDAYCGIGNENGARFHSDSWQKVHRMYYDALRVGGTPSIKAKIMFSAVYLGGPRWASATPDPATMLSFQGGRIGRANAASAKHSLGLVSTSAMVAQLKLAIHYVKTNNPTLAELEVFLMRTESRAIAETSDNNSNSGYSTNNDDSTSPHDTDQSMDPTTSDPGSDGPTTGAHAIGAVHQ